MTTVSPWLAIAAFAVVLVLAMWIAWRTAPKGDKRRDD